MTGGSAAPPLSVVEAIRATYGRKAAFDLSDSLVSRYVYRPLSFYLSVPFVRLGMSPNQVSFAGFGVAIAGMALLATGERNAAIIGSALCALQVLMDYVDGNIARLRAITSHLGKFVDGVIDTAIGTMMPIAVGVGLMRNPDVVLLNVWPDAAPQAALLLATVTAVATSLRAMLVFRLRSARFESGAVVAGQAAHASSADVRRGWTQRVAQAAEIVLRNEMFTMLSAVVLFAWAEVLGAYLIIRSVSSVLTLAIEVLRTWVLARRDLVVARSH